MTPRETGRSLSRWEGFGPESLAENLQAGVRWMEVTINDFWRTADSPAEVCARAGKALSDIRTSGIGVWSVHLPFAPQADISATDPGERRTNLAFMTEMIALAARFEPRYLVLHPSSEPIPAEERTLRLDISRDSIGLLAESARISGATLCIENLPRTGLGQTGEEMLHLTADHPGVRLCFDVNHLFHQSHADFLRALGPGRIATVHLSDYDFSAERHWLPGQGHIDWGELWRGLCDVGYEGIFMFECHGKPADFTAARNYILHCAAKSPGIR